MSKTVIFFFLVGVVFCAAAVPKHRQKRNTLTEFEKKHVIPSVTEEEHLSSWRSTENKPSRNTLVLKSDYEANRKFVKDTKGMEKIGKTGTLDGLAEGLE